MATRRQAGHARAVISRRRLAAIAVGLLLTACASEAASPTSEASPPRSAEPSATRTAEPTATPAAAAPPDLAGTWRRNVQREEVLLTLRDTGYRILRAGEMGSGSIAVDGAVITFFGSSRCAGIGQYRWAIEEGRLRLTEIDDPCSGRTDVLLRGTFGRVDG